MLLLGKRIPVRAFVHKLDARSDELRRHGAEMFEGDLLDPESVKQAMENVERAYFTYPVTDGLLEAATIFAATGQLKSKIASPRPNRRSSPTPQEIYMPPQLIFLVHLILGYVACLLWFGTYILPRLKSMDRFNAQRVIATIHSFRFFGLVFILPGVVGPNLPAGFATFAAYGDFATGVLAILALLTARIRPLFWFFVAAFNLVGTADLIVDYYHAIRLGLPEIAGQLGAAYVIVIVYVPMLMITNVVALYWLARSRTNAGMAIPGGEASS